MSDYLLQNTCGIYHFRMVVKEGDQRLFSDWRKTNGKWSHNFSK